MFCCHPRRTSDESFRRFAWRLIGLQKIGWIDHFEFGVMINMLMLLHGRAGNREAVRSWRVCWQPATWKAVEEIPATCPSSGSLHPPRRRANCCCLTRSRHVQLVAYGALHAICARDPSCIIEHIPSSPDGMQTSLRS